MRKRRPGEQSGPRAAHHLAIITITDSVDWLELARSQHRRALLKGDEWSVAGALTGADSTISGTYPMT
jgi:hypothetical protein